MVHDYLLLSLPLTAEANASPPVVGASLGQAHVGDASVYLEGTVFRLSRSGANLGPESRNELARLVLQRWLEVGDRCFEALVGDFAVVAARGAEVVCFKPLTSQFQIYYAPTLDTASGEARFWVSNRLAPLVARLPEGSRQLDHGYVMRLLMVSPGLQHSLAHTPFAAIKRLRPWHVLRFRDGQVTETQRVRRNYRYGRASSVSLTECGEEVRRLMRESVLDRVRTVSATDICCEISGGLDSSFVACLVGEVAHKPKGYMFSCADRPSHRYGEQAARAVADKYGFDLEIVDPASWATPRLEDGNARWEEPTDFFWYGPLFGPYTAGKLPAGSRVFTGYAGDALFMRSPLILPHLLRHGQARSFWREALQLGKLAQRSSVSIMGQSALALLPRPAYLKLATPFLGRRFNPFSVLDITADWNLREPITWLRRPQQDLVAEQEAYDGEGRCADEALIGAEIVRDDSISYLAHRRVVISPWLDAKGIDEHSPFCDERLFDFVYGEVPWEYLHGFDGPYKKLLRAAQQGVVPPEVSERKEDVFVFDRFRAQVQEHNAATLRALLGHASDVLPGLLDEQRLRSCFEELLFGKHDNSIRSLYVLLGYLLWHRGFFRRVAELEAHDAPDRANATSSDVG